MSPIPAIYACLERWFPTQTSRAAALGVSREIVRQWESQLDSSLRPDVRETTARTIDLVVATAREVERRVGDPVGAGRWMLAPQPMLRGRTVVATARDGRLEVVAQLLAPVPEGPLRTFSSEAVNEGARNLGVDAPAPRERPRSASKAAALRRIGEDAAVIGGR